MHQDFPFSKAINLVCTRSTNADHTALRRWYADHLQLLLTAPQLKRASLYFCEHTAQIPQSFLPPEYFCIYDFSSLQAFEAFENSHQKVNAGQLTQAAPGRDSIEIVQRVQWELMLDQSFQSTAKDTDHFSVAAFRLSDYCTNTTEGRLQLVRYLSDGLHQNFQPMEILSAKIWHRSAQIFVLLNTDIKHIDMAKLFDLPSMYAGAPADFKLTWATSARLLRTWHSVAGE